jgi:beta-lactam-binding protein with PASTA domain
VINKSVEKSIDMIEDAGLVYEIQDSIYRQDLPDGTVLDVHPNPGLMVKSGRTVYLVVSSKKPPYVEMPSLVGRSSLRFAKIELESRGLVLGNLTYVPSAEKDAVLSQRIGNTEIRGGTMIPKGTIINITLGDGLSGTIMDVPFLIGKTKEEVDQILQDAGLEANFFYDKGIEDTFSAVVYKQYPMAHNDEKMNLGEPLDLFLAKELPKNIFKDSALMRRLEQETK